ncbi:RHS repeat domain-containing protein [Flavobacterium sp. DG1-102-2]|uniref:RHS repeat domain-containing protein n=1 Tax=Flavobacterium sp. DG1-102-2 TaxID=3081663 RepID=UPI002949551F|nr:RHS repeat domain-containing protein [Flavobacterium sp. DG1-102-2]MDV6167114.1 RHS repeat domain-containing protein [Flavobacterium sp. DG1-102-2]
MNFNPFSKLIALTALFFQIITYGQISKTIPELTKPSPEVASLGRYGELPMNYYTGTANIDIPLYTIDFDGLDIPINLSYNTGGIRVDQESSWVGLGWTLSCEPIITKSTKGLCDMNTGYNDGDGKVGFPYTDLALPEDAAAYNVNQTFKDKIEFWRNDRQHVIGWDTEPDVFSINLFGESAKFILTQKALNAGVIGVKLINPDSRMKIIYDESTRTFTVTNDRGFVFYFTKQEYSITASGQGYSFSVNSGFNNPLITGWKVEKIVSPKGNIIFYNYAANSSLCSSPKAAWYRKLPLCPNFNNNVFNLYTDMPYYTNYVNISSTPYLKSLVFNDGRVDFTISDRTDIYKLGVSPMTFINISGFNTNSPKKLDNISIKNSSNLEVKNYNFEYTYFSQNQTAIHPEEIRRLKLDKISVNNQFYRSFEYIGTEALPLKTTCDYDYWGFFNGKKNMVSFPSHNKVPGCVPAEKPLIQFFGADRQPDFNYGKNGLLSKVIYPTKGYTVLNYEPHSIRLDNTTLSTEYPFEDYDKVEITSTSESQSVQSQSVYLNGTEINPFFKYKGNNVDPEPISGVATLEISCGTQFENNSGSNGRKCTVATPDVGKIAFQMINAATGQVVRTIRFSNDATCNYDTNCPPLQITEGEGNVRKVNIPITYNLPAGNYYFRVTGLKYPGNLYDADEGITSANPEYMKQYYFAVRFRFSIPKSQSNFYNKEVGGARIQSIVNYNHDGNSIGQTLYKYEKTFSDDGKKYSSGILIDPLNFGYIDDTGMEEINNSCGGMSGYTVRNAVVETDNIQSGNAPSQNYISYSQVQEIYSGSNLTNTTNGSKILYYNNQANVLMPNNYGQTIHSNFQSNDNLSNAFYPRYTYQESNGSLIKEEYYDNAGSKVKEIGYQYSYQSVLVGRGIKPKYKDYYVIGCGSLDHSEGWPWTMQIYTHKNESSLLSQKTETDYLTNGLVSNSSTYTYNSEYSIRTANEITSTGETKLVYNYYPGDSEVSSSPNVSTLVFKNIIGSPLQSKTTLNGNLIEQIDKEYALFNSNTLLAESKIKFSKDGAVSNDLYQYEQYTAKGKVAQYRISGGTPSVMIWGYNGTLPLAKIENATYTQVLSALSLTESAVNNLTAAPSNIRTQLPNALVTTYTYQGLIGISGITDTKGVTTSFEYDSQGRLMTVRDAGGKILSENAYNYKQ